MEIRPGTGKPCAWQRNSGRTGRRSWRAWSAARRPLTSARCRLFNTVESISRDNPNLARSAGPPAAFPGGNIPIGNINEAWARRLRDFLLERVSANSAHRLFCNRETSNKHAPCKSGSFPGTRQKKLNP